MCVCNERSMFSDFIDIITPSRVTSQGVSPGLRTVILLLALEDGQQRAILPISHVLYILKSPVNLLVLLNLIIRAYTGTTELGTYIMLKKLAK